jgi:predicted permease
VLARLWGYARGLVRRNRIEVEVDEELQFHVEMEMQGNVERGMTPAEARRVALRDLGGLTQTKEAVREVRAFFLDSVRQDLRFAVRSCRRSPAFALVAILTLALVIGASTAIFSALYGLVFRRLPYSDPGRLVMLWDSNLKSGAEHLPMMESAFPTFEREARSFEAMAPYIPPSPKRRMFAFKLWGTEERVSRASCTHHLFSVLGAAPILGRPFVSADAASGSAPVAILSYGFWRLHYGGRPDVVGKTLSLNFAGERDDYTIVGVLPQSFEFPFPLVPEKADVWVNLRYSLTRFLPSNGFTVVARLRKGASLRQAQTEIDTIGRRIERDHRRDYEGEQTRVVSLESELVRDIRTILWVLLAAIGCVLLIGCANIGHLLLVRAVSRERDYALRAALGAGRATLARGAFTEVLLLAVVGGSLGLLLAYWGMRAFLALLPGSLYIPRFDVIALDWRLLVVSASVSIGATACFGLLPAIRVLRPDLNPLLKRGARAKRRPASVFRRPGSILLVSEVCLALVLLTATVMLTRSFRALLAANVRFQPERMLTLDVSFSNFAVRTLPDYGNLKVSLFKEFNDRVAALPGVRSVAVADQFPLSGYANSFKADSGAGLIAQAHQPAELHIVSPSFFEMMAASLVGGRWLADSDVPASPPVAVINETMANRYFPDSNPLGRRIAPSVRYTDDVVSYLIVGIVRESDRFGKGDQAQPAVYLSESQVPLNRRSVVVRTTGDPGAVAGRVREAALQIYPGQMFVSDVRTGGEIVSEASARLRFASMLLTVLAAVALMLAVIGIYGLLAYYTAQRTHEMGIRLALGATRGGILRLVLRQGMLLAGAGVLAGSAVAAAFARSMTSVLYHVAPVEPGTFVGGASFLLVIACLACLVPARRAAKVDPVVALRDE